VSSVKSTPGDGSTVRAVAITYCTPPKPVEQNKPWQALNQALGVNLRVTFIADADFDAKMATVIAGDDLPDFISIGGGHAWQGITARIKGRLYGVPQERPLPATALFIDRNAFTAVGARDDTWTKTEFAAAVKDLSKNKQFGLGANKASPFGLRQYLAVRSERRTTGRQRAAGSSAPKPKPSSTRCWRSHASCTPPERSTRTVRGSARST
jgi:putative aldouronate transport system substrate-binding protein